MRFKSILGAFIFLCLASFIAMLIFLQSKTFGRVATRVISDISQKRSNMKVSIKSIGISLFPPGVELNKVVMDKKNEANKSFHAEFGKLGFYIGLIELEEKKLSLGEIRISDSIVNYNAPEDNEKPIEKIDEKIINQVFDFSNNLPFRIDTVLLQNCKVHINHDLLEAKRLKIFKKRDDFIVRFHVANLQPKDNEKISIDEIWGDAEIGRKNISLYRLKVQHDVHSLLIKGKITNYRLLKNADANLMGEASIYIKNIKGDIPLPDLIKLHDGFAHISFKTFYKDQKINGGIELSVSNLNSNIINAEQVIAALSFDKDILILNQFLLSNKEEKLRLHHPTEIFNASTNRFLFRPVSVHMENLDLNNALSILPSLNPLKGKLTGDLDFTYANNNLEFKPHDGFLIKNLGLVVGKDKPFTILMIKNAKLSASTFRLINKEFQIDSILKLNHSLLDIHGFINSKKVSIKAIDAIVDLEDFGNISQLDVKGKGSLDISVSGELQDTSINLKGNTKDFGLLGYKLGQVDKEISIDLADSSVVIKKMEATYRSTSISGVGVVNYDNSDIALGINSARSNFQDLKEILTPIFSKITFLPKDLDFNTKIDANIFGKTSLEDIKVKSNIQFNDLHAFGENFNSGKVTVGLSHQKISLIDLIAKKSKGEINGDFSYSMKSEFLKMNYSWDGFAISNFSLPKKMKLNLDGEVSGSFAGQGTTKDYNLILDAKISETRSDEYTFEDSKFNVILTPHSIKGKANILGQNIATQFDYSLNNTKPSKVAVDFNVISLKPFATAFFGSHLRNEDFSGNFKLSLDTQFKGVFEQVDLKASLESLVLRHENFNVNYSSNLPQFLIENNLIKKWNLAIQQPDLFVQTKGQGQFGQNVSLVNEIHLNSRIFEIFLSPVLSSEGFLRNIVRIDGQGNKYQYSVISKSSDLNLTIEGVPFPLNHLSYSMEHTDDRLVIQELKTTLDNGSVGIKGDVFFDDKNPDVNIKYYLDKAEIPILGKSMLNLTGEGIILGNAPPYNIGGEIIVNKAQIVNELNEFSQKSNALSQVRFLPPSQESSLGKYVNFNINVKIDTPARISNSLMDISMLGEVMLLGNPSRPRGEGRLYSPANSSRVFFKNSEYYITNADINFSPKKEISNPDFDVQATTLISSYKVYAKAYGDLERFNFDLTSDPSLPRNSILSLIAFGYTDEIQNSLQQRDQQNLTQVGVGSFVFDRFKISDILNKQFGLQVNLGTVLEQSQTDSLLSGRSQEGQGTLGRTRSATKIELKKRLDEALSLSVSSTMGGSIGQRQSMNLNYSLNKKVQLEGIYELRTNAEGETDIIDNSIGGDLKFRWTFK